MLARELDLSWFFFTSTGLRFFLGSTGVESDLSRFFPASTRLESVYLGGKSGVFGSKVVESWFSLSILSMIAAVKFESDLC